MEGEDGATEGYVGYSGIWGWDKRCGAYDASVGK